MSIVAIGEESFLPGFGLAGIRTVRASAADAMLRVREERSAEIIVFDDTVFSRLPEPDRTALETSERPVVIVMSRDAADADDRIERLILRVIGVHPHALAIGDTEEGGA